MTPTLLEGESFYLVCACGSRFLIGRRDYQAWKPVAFEAARATVWFRAHSDCWDKQVSAQERAP